MEETNLLVHEVKAREQLIFGDGKNPPKPPWVKEVWEEISSVIWQEENFRTVPKAVQRR